MTHCAVMLQHKQPLLVLMTEMMAQVQKLTDVVFLQQQLLLSAHCVLIALRKQGSLDANKVSSESCGSKPVRAALTFA